jgi:hypothetical protein
MRPERFWSLILGLALFPLVTVIALCGWVRATGGDLIGMGTLLAAAVGLAFPALVVWKGHGAVLGIYSLRSRLPEPIYSCLAIGVSGALAVGVLAAVSIVLLGHTRPTGWEFDRIPPWMAIAFPVGLACGLLLGIHRRRAKKSRVA